MSALPPRPPAPPPRSLSILADHISLRRLELNQQVASEILSLFRWSVLSTVAITMVLVIVDTVTMAQGIVKPSERLVTEHVLMALIGASVVQVGSAAIAIVYSLFGQPKVAETESD